MRDRDVRRRAPGRFKRTLLLCLTALLVVFLAGCSDDAPSEDPAAVTGKTPVVRPEDVHVRGPGGAAVLAPDYRQGLTADIPDEAAKRSSRVATVPAAGPAAPATEPASGRLFAGQPAPSSAGKPIAAPVDARADPTKTPSAAPTVAEVVPPKSPASPPAEAAAGPARASAPEPGPASGQASPLAGFPVAGCRQLVLVVASNFEADRGTLRRFDRSGPGAPWREAGAASPCALGRKGLGVGRGLTPPLPGPAKRQGDGRTPAGLFPLPTAFGYADATAAKAAGVRLPYVVVTDRTACLTDPASDLFGRVVGPNERPAGGSVRQERMVRDDRANVWGVAIGHNLEHPDPEAGSCVFLNVRPAGGPPTGGSIGCPEGVAATLAAWLDPAAGPILAVLPAKAYEESKAAWGLP